MTTTAATTDIFACKACAPSGIVPRQWDDGQATCAGCGVFGYGVRPYPVPEWVVGRGYWRHESGREVEIHA
jgi:hypothetical protein